MRVREVMTEGVECLRPDDSIRYAAERMRDLNVGSMPICGDNDRLTGMITDRDITIRGTADRCDPETTSVRDMMTADLVFCLDRDDVRDAAERMKENQIRRLVVINDDRRLVGIVSLGDLAVRTGDNDFSGEVLEQVSEPAEPVR